MPSGIYMISFGTDKCYIGSALKLNRRVNEHLSGLRRRKHSSIKLQHAFDKYGEECFSYRPIIVCRPQDLIMYEQLAIDHYKACANGYNIRPKAESCLGVKHSEKSKENFRRGAQGRVMPPMSDEAKRNKSIAAKNRVVRNPRVYTEEQKQRAREIAITRFKGEKLTEAHKQKLREAKLGRKLTQEHKDKIRDKQLAFRAKQRGEA